MQRAVHAPSRGKWRRGGDCLVDASEKPSATSVINDVISESGEQSPPSVAILGTLFSTMECRTAAQTSTGGNRLIGDFP
jgi:hypothetical protein